MPVLLVDTVLFCIVSYWTVGLQPHAYPFFMMVFILVAASITASSCGKRRQQISLILSNIIFFYSSQSIRVARIHISRSLNFIFSDDLILTGTMIAAVFEKLGVVLVVLTVAQFLNVVCSGLFINLK